MKITITLIAVVLSFTLNAQIIQDQKIIYSNTQTFQDSVKMSGLTGSGTSLIIDENGVISKGSGGSGATSINDLSDGKTNVSENVGLGANALLSLTSGSANTALGYQTLTFNTTGNNNTALGHQVLFTNTTGGYNTASGAYALWANTIGDFNIAVGYQSLNSNTSGDSNIGIGIGAGGGIVTGSNNTIIGGVAGTSTLSSTVLIAAGTTERLKVDSSGLYINGVSFNLNSAEIFLGNSSNQSVATAVTGEVTISNTGVTEVTGIDGNIAITGFKPIITQTGQTRTLSEGDEGSLIIATNVDFTTVTIPLNIFTLGTEIELLRKSATGTLLISAASGVTLNGASQGSESVTAQWGSVTIKLIGTNEWWAVGGI